MRTDAQRRADAEHEATHAVAAMALGIELAEVVLDGDDPLAPYVRIAPDPKVVGVNGRRRWASWARTCDEVTMVLAPVVGGAPPFALEQPLDDLPTGDDLSRARAMARSVCRSERETSALLYTLSYRAIGIVESPGFAEARATLVDSLMRHGRLSAAGDPTLKSELLRAQVSSWAAGQPPTDWKDGYVSAA